VRSIRDSTFAIATSGFADGPAQALRDYLVAREARRVTVICHPLVAGRDQPHSLTTYSNGTSATRLYRLPHRPPYTYVFDLVVPRRRPVANAWFGFNNLAALRGLGYRERGRLESVYYWAVDFVPDRFGSGLLTRVYNRVDRHVSLRVDARIELSEVALRKRTAYLGLEGRLMAPAHVVPMGAWLDTTAKVQPDAWEKRRLVFLGHLVERQGVGTLIDAMRLVVAHYPAARLDVIGGGPLEERLRQRATVHGLMENVTFHGFVPDHRDVEALLADASIAVAPYVDDAASFTRYADPGKLKAYLGASLPIVLSDVPPNAGELAGAGAGFLVDGTPEAIAAATLRLMGDQAAWLAAHRAASDYARSFDWNSILGDALEGLGWS
jgi:glycosyltransferase involved in cell wall biosynthesis